MKLEKKHLLDKHLLCPSNKKFGEQENKLETLMHHQDQGLISMREN